MTTLTITAKGQVTLKRDLLEHIGARVGDKLIADPMPDGSVRLAAPPKISWNEIAGILYRPGQRRISIEEMDEGIAEAVAERDRLSRY